MKARLVETNNEYHLITASGKLYYFTSDTVADFIKHHNRYYREIISVTQLFKEEELLNYNGRMIASIDDSGNLIIYDNDFLSSIFFENIASYITSVDYAEKHHKTSRIVKRMCTDKRIPGAVQKGVLWLIPEDAPYPDDLRAGRKMPSKKNKNN